MAFVGSINVRTDGLEDADFDLTASLRAAHHDPNAVREAIRGYPKNAVLKAVRLLLSQDPAKSWQGREIAEALPHHIAVRQAVVRHIRSRAAICMPDDVKWADSQA